MGESLTDGVSLASTPLGTKLSGEVDAPDVDFAAKINNIKHVVRLSAYFADGTTRQNMCIWVTVKQEITAFELL